MCYIINFTKIQSLEAIAAVRLPRFSSCLHFQSKFIRQLNYIIIVLIQDNVIRNGGIDICIRYIACIDEIIHVLNLFHDGYDQQNNLIKL